MNVNDIPFKEFFEQSIKTICEHEPRSIVLVAVLKDGNVIMKEYEESEEEEYGRIDEE